jgi:hypothetical protein
MLRNGGGHWLKRVRRRDKTTLESTLTHPDSELQLCLDDELSRSLNNEQ